MPTCATLGEAAGIAASIALNGNVRSVDTNELRKILKGKGAKVD
jgi:hypothetical protein